jgi:hypothetical protein
MSQATESTNIMSTINKIEEYKELLQKVLPFTKSENEIVKRAAWDFNILLKSVINEKNSPTLLFLNEGIKHAIDHFTTELLDLINNRIDPNIHMGDSHYGLLNDIAKVICQQLLFKNKLNEVKDFLMKI